MSSLIVDVTPVLEILPHDNADTLEILKIKGWYCISTKGVHKVGDSVVYFPVDTLLPIKLAEHLNVWNYLSNKTEEYGRIKTVKLRGEYSQGLVIAEQNIIDYIHTEYSNQKIAEGMANIVEILELKKWDPPIKIQMRGNGRNQHPDFHRYTDIENYNNYPNVIQIGEEVIITEKLHGTNFRVANIDGEIHVGSHNVNLKEDPDNLYWKCYLASDIKNILYPGMMVYGEIYGLGVQKKTHYGEPVPTIRVFDITQNGKYEDWDFVETICHQNNIPLVPILYKGPWSEDLTELRNGNSTLADHIREGVVVKTTIERYERKTHRAIVKLISEKFALKGDSFGEQH